MTHFAAILVGVVVTMILMGTFSNRDKCKTADKTVPTHTTAGSKKKKKRKKTGAAPVSAEPQTRDMKNASRSIDDEKDKEKENETPLAAARVSALAGKKKKKKKPKASSTSGTAITKEEETKSNGGAGTHSKLAPVASTPLAVPAPIPRPAVDDEWVVEGGNTKKLSRRPKAKAAAPTTAVSATSSTESTSISIEASKIGIIIGPKGTTMKAIEEATGCQLEVNAPSKDEKPARGKKLMAGIIVKGGDASKAKQAIKELANKGYAKLLQADGFSESYIQVHPKYLSEIVGPKGATIKALQSKLEVKITIPSTDWTPNSASGMVQMAKIGVAGSKENARQCKHIVQTLLKVHHHELTHPGMIHEELYVPTEFFHCVIGPRGSEIKHIKGNYKVEVHMPDAGSDGNIVVVGKQINVDKAITHIQNLMNRDSEQRERKYNDDYY